MLFLFFRQLDKRKKEINEDQSSKPDVFVESSTQTAIEVPSDPNPDCNLNRDSIPKETKNLKISPDISSNCEPWLVFCYILNKLLMSE